MHSDFAILNYELSVHRKRSGTFCFSFTSSSTSMKIKPERHLGFVDFAVLSRYTPRVSTTNGVVREPVRSPLGVIGDDDGRVDRLQSGFVERDRLHGWQVWPRAHAWRYRDVGVVVGDVGAAFEEEVDDLEGGAFAGVVDVGLVGEAEDEDLGALDGLALLVEGVGRACRRRSAGIWVLISPASSMKRVGWPDSRAFQAR